MMNFTAALGFVGTVAAGAYFFLSNNGIDAFAVLEMLGIG